MFGYVITNATNLSKEASARYQESYCGLCHTLGKRYGGAGRMTLSYDLTFLNLLLASLYEDEHATQAGKRNCIMHPFRKMPWRTSHETAYCADMSIALHYYAAKDKWQDDKNPGGLAFMWMLEEKRKAVEQRYPTQCATIATELANLAALEAEQSQDIEAVSDCFGKLMAAIFVMRQDHWANDLQAIGFTLGKFIYLLDAYDDLAKDKKHGSYNPLKHLSTQPDYEAQILEILQNLIGRCAQSFERLPCVADVDILQNILYSGVWLRYECKQQQQAKTDKKHPEQPSSNTPGASDN